jgi:hypothetical protein
VGKSNRNARRARSAPGPLNTNGNNGTLTTPDITFQLQPTALDAPVAEPATGTVKVPVTVSIVGPAPTKNVKVKYTTVDGSAVSSPGAFKDYTKKKGTLSFRKGVTSRVIEIRVAADDFDGEGTQYFSVQLSNPTPGVALRLDNARVDITD